MLNILSLRIIKYMFVKSKVLVSLSSFSLENPVSQSYYCLLIDYPPIIAASAVSTVRTVSIPDRISIWHQFLAAVK